MTNANAIPFADQYIGVWGILDEYAAALMSQAKIVNLQLHLEAAASPEGQAKIAAQASTEVAVNEDGIAIIRLQGSLTKHAGSLSESRSMVAARRQVRAAAADPAVKGILLHVDSPGGTIAGTIDLADDVAAAKAKKPVFAYIEDLGASAAYWIASQATKVYANRGARIGSIGVLAVLADFSGAAEKEGVVVNVVKFGAMKGVGVEGTKITPEQLAEWQRSVDAYGKQFVEAIAAGRNLSLAEAGALADGRVHDSVTAESLNLIDGVRSLSETLAELGSAGTKQRRPKAMSEPEGPKAATLAELKAAMPGAGSDFLLAQLEANATSDQAVRAWATHLQGEVAKERKAREEAEAAAEAAKKASQTKAANDPAEGLGGGGDTTAAEGGLDAWRAAIDKVEADYAARGRKITRQQAASIANKQNPGLRESALAG